MSSRAFLAPIILLTIGAAARADDDFDDKMRVALDVLATLGEEKADYVPGRKKTIADLQELLTKAERMEVFQLDPREVKDDKGAPGKTFHGYEILRQARVEKAEQRKELAEFLGKRLHWSELLKAVCFNPRHGLRLVQGKRTVELVICFECNRIDVYEGDKKTGSLAVLAKEHKIFEQILDGARK